MAAIYAGILGPLALLTVIVRGLLHGDGAASVLWSAWCGLVVFAAAGYMIGWLAGRIVEDSVHSQIAAELAAVERNSAAETPARRNET